MEAFVVVSTEESMVVRVGKKWSRRENDDRILLLLVVVVTLAADEWCN